MTINLDKVFVIAEAGVNHDGKLEQALKLVDVAINAGADAIKFQIFLPGECTGKFAIKVDYLNEAIDKSQSRYDLTNSLALSFEDFIKIKDYCDSKGITFITTPDGLDSLEFIVEKLEVKLIKIASTELTNLAFLKAIASKKLPFILSTGLSNLGEIEKAIQTVQSINNNFWVLHCTSEYPAPLEEVNIRSVKTIRDAFKVRTGFSDHSIGYESAIAAVTLGAEIIEKHFTLDKNLPGPDHKASLNPKELKEFIVKIRNTETLLGSGIKKPTKSELRNMDGIRRSVVASKDLRAGQIITSKDFTFKRPGYGIHPYDSMKIIGLKLRKDLKFDEPLKWEHFKEN